LLVERFIDGRLCIGIENNELSTVFQSGTRSFFKNTVRPGRSCNLSKRLHGADKYSTAVRTALRTPCALADIGTTTTRRVELRVVDFGNTVHGDGASFPTRRGCKSWKKLWVFTCWIWRTRTIDNRAVRETERRNGFKRNTGARFNTRTVRRFDLRLVAWFMRSRSFISA